MNDLNFTRVTVIGPSGEENILENIGDPKSVTWVVIENLRTGHKFELHKTELETKLNYYDSVDEAEDFAPGGRLGTREEWITIYNAIHTAGLNDTLSAIGGDKIKDKYYWTEEVDEDERYLETDKDGQSGATYAWYYSGAYGGLYASDARISSSASRVLRAFLTDSLKPSDSSVADLAVMPTADLSAVYAKIDEKIAEAETSAKETRLSEFMVHYYLCRATALREAKLYMMTLRK